MMWYAIVLSAIVHSGSVAPEPPGEWEQSFWLGSDSQGADATRAINLIHVWDGQTTKVLVLSYDIPPLWDSRLWTPPPAGSTAGFSGIFEEANVASYLFCGGHTAMADGRVLHVGGRAVANVDVFDPWLGVGNQWNNPLNPPDMAFRRWYPTATTLANGQVLITSGSSVVPGPGVPPIYVTIPELYDPTTNLMVQVGSAQRQ